jgi:hypothetical protein
MTRVFGEQKDRVVIEATGNDALEIYATDAIFKFWFSDGTVIGIKYGKDSVLYPNIWHVKVLNQGTAPFIYSQCFRETLLYYSDVYETEAELVRYEVIPRTYYQGDNKT